MDCIRDGWVTLPRIGLLALTLLAAPAVNCTGQTSDAVPIALNQVGFTMDGPKRFTAPLSEDGTPFQIRAQGQSEILASGTIQSGLGDFTSFRPNQSGSFRVHVGETASDTFVIDDNLWQTYFWQSAVDFLIDSRSVVGTHPSAFGGCPWRDGTYYDFILPSMVMFYLADQERIQAMPRQLDWEADKQRVLSSEFKFDAKNPCSQGVMEAVTKYFQTVEPPVSDSADLLQLIHWGTAYYTLNPATKDPSSDPIGRQIHSQTLEQLAFVLWAAPKFQPELPPSLVEACRQLAFENWESAGCLSVDEWWQPESYLTVDQVTGKNPMGGRLHPFKGRHAPGHSIVPNLLMYEIADRMERDDANRYLDAAVMQTEWLINHLDWSDPRTTKGHRMSENKTITGLVWFLQNHPQHAPAKLLEKIEQWAEVVISRSDNMWDFRRYDLEDHWTIPKLNETGNLVAFASSALAASWVVRDQEMARRLHELAIAQIDNVYGRNPKLAAAPHHPEMGFPEIERGWPKGHKNNVCARLELCRGSLSASPGTEMYPYQPDGRYRHAEGWVNYGASWMLALAYLEFDRDHQQAPGISVAGN